MSPVMRVSDENWNRLKRFATPLEDSADDALGKALSAAENWINSNATDQPYYDDSSRIQHGASEIQFVSEAATKPDPDSSTNMDAEALPKDKGIPASEYRRPILETLYGLGGKAAAKDVLATVEQRMKHLFCDADYQFNKNGTDVKWHNRAQWGRFALVKEGFLKSNSGWGIWELTELGTTTVENKEE